MFVFVSIYLSQSRAVEMVSSHVTSWSQTVGSSGRLRFLDRRLSRRRARLAQHDSQVAAGCMVAIASSMLGEATRHITRMAWEFDFDGSTARRAVVPRSFSSRKPFSADESAGFGCARYLKESVRLVQGESFSPVLHLFLLRQDSDCLGRAAWLVELGWGSYLGIEPNATEAPYVQASAAQQAASEACQVALDAEDLGNEANRPE